MRARRLRDFVAAERALLPEGAISTNCDRGQVFWLTDHPTHRAFSAPVRGKRTMNVREWPDAAFVPDYSGGSTVELHHLPSDVAVVSRHRRCICIVTLCRKRRQRQSPVRRSPAIADYSIVNGSRLQFGVIPFGSRSDEHRPA